MDGLSLEKLERLARALGIVNLRQERIDWTGGEIFYAYGEDSAGVVHGIWGCRGAGRSMTFSKDVRVDQVRQALINDAAGFVQEAQARGLLCG